MFGLLPFFFGWTCWGTSLFFKINQGQASCPGQQDTEQGFPFIIFWLILSYSFISCYLSLLLFGLNADHRSKQVRKSMIQLLRRLSQSPDDNQELYDNAVQNIQDEVNRRQDAVLTLQEYGVYFMLQGLKKEEFQHIRVIRFTQSQQ